MIFRGWIHPSQFMQRRDGGNSKNEDCSRQGSCDCRFPGTNVWGTNVWGTNVWGTNVWVTRRPIPFRKLGNRGSQLFRHCEMPSLRMCRHCREKTLSVWQWPQRALVRQAHPLRLA